MTNRPFTEVDLLKKQLAEETKEKYTLYKKIKQLNEEIRFLKNKSPELSSNFGPNEIQRNRT